MGGTNPSSKKRGQIVGGTLGTIAGLIILGLIIFFFLRRRRRRAQHTIEEDFDKPIESPSIVENSPTNPTTIAHFNDGDSKAQLMMMYADSGGPNTGSPSSESGSRVGEGSSSPSNSGQQQQQQQTRLVPQRAANLHVTNQAPGEEKPLPLSPGMMPKPQTQAEDQNLRREVERLRLEMDAIRAGVGQQQPHVPTEEPPPRYADS